MAAITKKRPTKTRVRPFGDNLLVRPDAPEHATTSGLVIPDTATEKPDRGTVLAVGLGGRSEQTGMCRPRSLFGKIHGWMRDHRGYQSTPSQQALEAITHTAYFRHR